MPLLFILAGISTFFALKKRTVSQYIKERLIKLLLPFVSGILLIMPVVTYFAGRFHNGYAGGFFAYYKSMLSQSTDFSGFEGGFGIGHLWFVIFLFAVSLLALPITANYKGAKRKFYITKLLTGIFISAVAFAFIGQGKIGVGGRSLIEYFVFFIIGYFMAFDDSFFENCKKYAYILSGFSVLFIGAAFFADGIAYGLLSRFCGWICMLALLGLGQRFLNFRNTKTDYLLIASFQIYLFHLSYLVGFAFAAMRFTNSAVLQISFILVTSAVSTAATYELIRRIPGARILFGIKKADNINSVKRESK